MINSSIFRNSSSSGGNNGDGGDTSGEHNSDNQNAGAVLVTGPQVVSEQSGVVNVLSERYETVDVSAEQQHQQQEQEQQQKNPLMKLLDQFGAGMAVSGSASSTTNNNSNHKSASANNREMEELGAVKIVSPVSKREECGGFDICREYSYSADEQDEHGGGKRTPPLVPLGASEFTVRSGETITAASEQEQQQGEEESAEAVLYTYLLGKTYHPMHHFANRRQDEASLFWFTYRCDFPEIAPYGITSDAGWGCMLRSAQMLMAQALRMHFRGRDWRPPSRLPQRKQDAFLRQVLTWFADYPSLKSRNSSWSDQSSIYSLHNMVAAGLQYDKLPGEWYGPGTACYVLRDLVALHQKQQALERRASNAGGGISNQERNMFRVHIAPQGAVYRDAIQDLMTTETRAQLEAERKKKHDANPQAHPLDLDWEDDLMEQVGGKVEWDDTSLLLLVPLRLGLKTFNEEYVPAVAHLFSLPQSVGILGGRPRGARWFYGAISDGKILALDPHTVQSAPKKCLARVSDGPGAKGTPKTTAVVELSDDYMRSCHTSYPEVCDLRKMDPSLALGFYCRHEASLNDLMDNLRKYKEEHPYAPELFGIEDCSPDYAANVSSTVNEMMMDSSLSMGDDMLGDHSYNDGGSDEDDYVML